MFRNFATAAVERLVKTFVQAVLALLIADKVVSLVDIDVTKVLGVAGLAALISLLTSIASYPLGPQGSPSVTQEK